MTLGAHRKIPGRFYDYGGAMYNVKHFDFGVKGDGVTDDGPALQAAIDVVEAGPGGGILFLPEGTYLVKSTLNMSNVNIVGAGELATTIKAGANSITLANCFGGVELRNLLFDGDRNTFSNCTGMFIGRNTGRCKIFNCRFARIDGSAIHIDEGFDNHFYSIHIEDCGKTTGLVPCLYIMATTGTSNMNFFYGLQIQNGFAAQVSISPTAFNNVFSGGHLEWFTSLGTPPKRTYPNVLLNGYRNKFFGFHCTEGTYGFDINGGIRNELHGCFCNDQATYGLRITGTLAKGNKIFGGFYEGFQIDSVQDPGRNILMGVETSGRNCQVTNSSGTSVVGCHITGASGAEPIRFENTSSDCDFSHNTIKSASGQKALFAAAATGLRIVGNLIEVVGSPANAVDTSGSGGGVITNNVLIGSPSGPVINDGTGAIVHHNEGHVTESSGTETIASGNTTVVVTHRLGQTPTLDDLTIVMTSDPANDVKYFWIDTITSTEFTINVKVDPGGGGVGFAWSAYVH